MRLLCIRLSKNDPSPQNYSSISNITWAQQVVGGEGLKNQRIWCHSKRKVVSEEEQDFDKITKTNNHSQCNQECIKNVNRVSFDLMLSLNESTYMLSVFSKLFLFLFFGHLWSEVMMRRSREHHGRLTLPPPSSASISAQEVVAPLTALSMEITPICLEWLRTAPALPLSSGFSVGKLKITAPRG